MALLQEEIRRQLFEMLDIARTLSPIQDCDEIRCRLSALQEYCQAAQKNFIFVEERINCHQFDLGGSSAKAATLFRGPKQDASVAICITDKGSLLYRNSSRWKTYRHGGDVYPDTSMSNKVS